MKRHYAVLALLVMASVMAGCIGTKSRTDLLVPAIQQSWVGVRVDAVGGGLGPDVLAQFDQAVEYGDAETMSLLWPTVRLTAEAGIQARVDAGSVSTGVAASLLERVNNMDEAIATLKRRPPS